MKLGGTGDLAAEWLDVRTGAMPRAVEVAYHHIRRAIATQAVRPGDSLVEMRLAAEIGVSRTPVRAALARLHAEGLVVLERYRNCTVARLTLEEVTERYRLRALLEGQGAGRAATRITPAAVADLVRVQDEMEASFAGMELDQHLPEFDKLNNDFHGIIGTAADSPRLVEILMSTLEMPASVFPVYNETADKRMRRTHRQHREIIDALSIGHAAWAEAQMTAHLLSLVQP